MRVTIQLHVPICEENLSRTKALISFLEPFEKLFLEIKLEKKQNPFRWLDIHI